MTEQELLDNGWKREMLSLHIRQYNQSTPSKAIALSYDIADDFSSNQISALKHFVEEVNIRFPEIKMFITGGGFVKDETEDGDD